MNQPNYTQRIINHLSQFVTEKKTATMKDVLSQRTRYITAVLEDIFQSQNMSAVIRTCECLGVQDIHVIEKNNLYEINKKVLKGSHKWVNIIRYKNKEKYKDHAALCYTQLHEQGYKILVTTPAPDGLSIEEVPVDEKIALVLGNELDGVSDVAKLYADYKTYIPMVGFTESFNVSVSAALCLQTLLHKIRTSQIHWQLTQAESEELYLQWLRKSVRRSDLIEQEFMHSIQ